MINAFLFPGQGSQEPGMGRALYEQLPEARARLDEANEVLGYDLKSLLFEGPAETLTDTRYAQTAIYTCSAMVIEKLRADGVDCAYAAGHSLGEYSALYAAGVFSFADGLRLVDKRARVMSRANGQGLMAAVLGLEEAELQELLAPYGQDLVMANLNTKTQIVVSGLSRAVDDLEARLRGREDVKLRRLRVSAAFHSPQMAEAAEIMAEELEKQSFHAPRFPVVPNVTGKITQDPEELRRCLIAQITGQVRWCDSVLALKAAGVELFYEVGHGDVLKKMHRAITLRPKCVGADISLGNETYVG